MVPVVLITTIVCAAIATTISWYFVTHSTPLVVPAVAACCGAFVLSSLVLLPADAFAGRGAGLEGLIGFWRTLYWAAFILGLLATHTLHELLVAGEFSRVGRLRAAVRASLRLYAMMLACAIVGCVWMLFVMGISPVELPNVVMILINSYGMVLLALLQGRGMVEVPRQLWRRALPRDELSHRYYVLGAVDEMRDASATQLRELLAKVQTIFGGLTENAAPTPTAIGQVSMYLAGKWYGLRCPLDPQADPVGRLDVSVLQDRLLAPILGIADVRTSKRIDFVGGIRGTAELVKRIDAEGGVAFSMFPVTLGQLMDISDAGQIMPPKSTWFEPKLRSGLFIHTF